MGKMTGEELDGLVHDLKGQEAASINNAGKQAQIDYLVTHERRMTRGWLDGHPYPWVTVYVRGGVAEVDRSPEVRVEVLDYDNDGCTCVPDGDAHSHEVHEAQNDTSD